MPEALVGTVGAVTQGVAGAAVTPVWQGNEPRTAGNKLICWVGVTGTATLPTTPAGWNIAKQIAGTSCSSTIYYRDATGGDAAPTIALIASGVIAASLGEYSGLVAGAPEQSGSAATAVSPIVATAGGADGQIGNLMVTNLAAFFSASRSPTLTNTYTNATAVARDNAGTSIANHYSQAYGGPTTANSLADKDSFALGASTSLTGMALVLASFKPMLDVNVSDAVGTSESAATQTLVDNTNGVSDAVGVADGPPNATLVHNTNGVSDAVGHSESVTVALMPPDQLVSVRDIATVTRDNWVPNPSFEYDTLAGAPALWSTATDGTFITTGATATVVSDTNTVDSSGTKAVELVGDGVSAKEGMAILITPPDGFKLGRLYALQFAVRVISGDTSINFRLGAAHGDVTLNGSNWNHLTVVASFLGNVASATLYLTDSNASAYVRRIDAVMVRELTSTESDAADQGGAFVYADGDTNGAWAGTAGQSTSLGYGDVPRETLVFNTAVRDIATVTRDNWCPNPSAEYDTLGSAPALWSTATDGFHITAGATATVVSDTNTADASGTKAIELVGNGVSAREGMAIVVTPPGGFKAGRRYVVQMAMRYISGDGNISLELGAATSGTDISSSGAWAHRSVFTSSGMISDDVASATLYIVSTNALAYTWRIDAVLVREQTTGDFNVGATYVDGDTAGGIWAGTAGQSTSLAYGDVAIAERIFDITARELVTVTRDNWVPNPSFEYDTLAGAPALWSTATDGSNLTAGATATVVSDTNTVDASGTQAVALVGDGLSTKEGMAILITPPGGFKAGRNYTVQVAVNVISGSAKVHLALGSASNTTTIFNVGWVHLLLVSFFAADTASAKLYISNTFAAAYVWHIDAVLVREETSDDDRGVLANNSDRTDGALYGDGDTGVWAGTAGQSTSFSYGDIAAIVLVAAFTGLSITTSDSAATSESLGRLLEALANTSDAVSAAESTGQTLVHNATVSDAAAAAENARATLVHNALTSDAVSVTESTIELLLALVTTSEAVSATESTLELLLSFIAASDSIGAAESRNETLVHNPIVSDSVTVSESLAALLVALAAVSDSITATESIGETLVDNAAVSDAVTAAETVARTLVHNPIVSDSITANEALTALLVSLANVSDSVSTAEATAELLAGFIAVSDLISATESPLELLIAFATASDSVSTAESTNETQVYNAATSDAISAAENTIELLVSLIAASDSVTVAESLAELLLSFVTLSDAVSVDEAASALVTLVNALAATVSDSITVAEATSELLESFANVSDSVAVTEALAQLLVAFVTTSDSAAAAESTNETLVDNAAVSDAVSLAESLARTLVHNAAVSDSTTVSETVLELLLSFINASEAVLVSEAPDVVLALLGVLLASVSDAVMVDESTSFLVEAFLAVSDAPTVSESTLEALVSFISTSDAAAAAESTNETLVHNASTSDAITASELAASLLVSLISQSESVATSETITELLVAFIASSDSISVSDNELVVLSVLGAIVLAIQENVGVDEAASAALLALITVSDAPTLSESAQAALSVAIAATDAATVAEALILRPESFVAVLDALTASDSVAASLANTIAALEAVAVAESSSSSLSIAALVAEGINVLDAAGALLVSLVATSDGAAVGDAIALTLANTIAISEMLAVQDAPSIDALLLAIAVSQAVGVDDEFGISLLVVLLAGVLTSTTSVADLISESAEAVMLTSRQRAAKLDTELS